MKRVFVAAVASALTFVAAARGARGQGDAPADAAPPPSPQAEAKAKSLFVAGTRAYDNGQFDVALQAFEQAHAIYPKDTLLFSMAQSHRRLFVEHGTAKHRDAAIKLFRDYLARTKSGKRKADANRALGELEAAAPKAPTTAPGPVEPEKKKTRLYVSSTTPGVKVALDGGPESPPNTTFEVTPGKHRVRLWADGYFEKVVEVDAFPEELVPVSHDLVEMPGRLEIVTASGADVNVDGKYVGEAPLRAPLELSAGRHFVSVELPGHRTHAQTVDVARGSKVRLDAELATTTQRDLSYVVFGVAAASAVTSAVLVGVAFHEQSRANDVLLQQETTGITRADVETYESARDARDRLAIAAGATGATAGALLVVGLGLLLADSPERVVPPAPAEKPAAPPPAEPKPPEIEDVAIVPAVGPDAWGAFAGFRF